MAQVHINGVTYELQDSFEIGSKELMRLEAQLMQAEELIGRPQAIGVRVEGRDMVLRLRPGGVWAWGVVPDDLG
jgi:hypothetical protein